MFTDIVHADFSVSGAAVSSEPRAVLTIHIHTVPLLSAVTFKNLKIMSGSFWRFVSHKMPAREGLFDPQNGTTTCFSFVVIK